MNFVFSKDTEDKRAIHSTSDNVKFTPYDDANKVVNELFESLLSRYQGNLKEVTLFLIQFNLCSTMIIR